MIQEQETIYYPNGGCDLDLLDKEEEYNSYEDDLPRELKTKEDTNDQIS